MGASVASIVDEAGDDASSPREFVRHSRHEMAIFDLSMRYLDASALYRERWGLPDSIIGQSHYELFPDLPERWRQIHREVLQGAWRSAQRDAFARLDGTVEWTDWEMGPWRRRDGTIGGAVVLSSNAAPLMRLRRQLRDVEGERHVMMRETPDGIAMVSREGVILSLNSALERMFGYPQDELLGSHVDHLLPLVATRWAIGQETIVRAVRKDGSRFPAQVVVNELNRLGGGIVVVQDLSETVALREEILSIASLEKERLGRELHDATQQELTAMTLFARSLVKRLEEIGAQADDLALAQQLAAQLTSTQQSVQRLARGLLPIPMSADGLRDALAALCAAVGRDDKVAVTTEFSGCVPALNDDAATHLYRIAQEALNNALRHASASRVVIRLISTAQACELQVEDDGIGCPAVATAAPGVGLRLMEHRCSLAGGHLEISRVATGGTRVVCVVPAES